MKKNFKKALKHVLLHEGGWADHPRDPGGATMKGVTLTTYRRHFGQEKSKKDLKSISDHELAYVYRSGYWDKCQSDKLPAGIDYAVFDAAVNSGPGRGVKWLQAAVGAAQDGAIGPKTLARIKTQKPQIIIIDMGELRLRFLHSLATWETFGRGWQSRIEGVLTTATTMALGQPAEVIPSIDYRVVKKGSRGKWVKKLQKALGIQVDGRFGAVTDITLRAWQQEQALEVDGIAGYITYRTLGLVA